jgi:hypothetical protein
LRDLAAPVARPSCRRNTGIVTEFAMTIWLFVLQEWIQTIESDLIVMQWAGA